MRSRRASALVLAGGLLLVSACSSDDTDPAPSRDGLARFALLDASSSRTVDRLPRARKSDPALQRVLCSVRSAHGVVTVALDLPMDAQPDPAYKPAGPGAGCQYVELPRTYISEDKSFARSRVTISLRPTSKTGALRHDFEFAKPEFSNGVPAGDDSYPVLALQRDVGTFGGVTRGDALNLWCFCDGQSPITQSVIADGVRLDWAYIGDSLRLIEKTRSDLNQAIRRAGTVTGR